MTDRTRLWLAWSVHLFTASGAVVGVLALLAVHVGDLRAAALWMIEPDWDSVQERLSPLQRWLYQEI